MTDDPIDRQQTGPDVRPLTDPIGLALTAIGAGAIAGAFIITLGLIALRIVQNGAPQADAASIDFTLLSGAVLAGPVVAVTTSLLLTKRIHDLWRRAVASAIAVFCAFILSGLAAPLDMIAGRVGLFVFAFALLAGAAMLTRRAHRIAAQ